MALAVALAVAVAVASSSARSAPWARRCSTPTLSDFARPHEAPGALRCAVLADHDLVDGLAVDGQPVLLEGDVLVAAGRPVGRVQRAERRIAWERPMEPELARRVHVERALFDARSTFYAAFLADRPPASSPAAWLDASLVETASLAPLVAALPSLRGMRVLELGGSGEATRGFLTAGVARVDQLDVSPGMQQLARARLSGLESPPVVQHTTFAERLPFADAVFDLVYSRHCLHHMDRARVVPEVRRVLRPAGAVLVIEPYLPRPLARLAFLRRRLVRAERGTDHPLGGGDLALFLRHFAHVDLRAEPAAATLARALPRASRALARHVDPRLPDAAVRLFGGRIHLLAR